MKQNDGLIKKFKVLDPVTNQEIADNLFVLNLDTDRFARAAILQYSIYIKNEQLYNDLLDFYKKNKYEY